MSQLLENGRLGKSLHGDAPSPVPRSSPRWRGGFEFEPSLRGIPTRTGNIVVSCTAIIYKMARCFPQMPFISHIVLFLNWADDPLNNSSRLGEKKIIFEGWRCHAEPQMRLRLMRNPAIHCTENYEAGMLSSTLRSLLLRTQPITLIPCRYDSVRHFSRSCSRLQAELVDNLTPTNRIRNIAIIAHGEWKPSSILKKVFFWIKLFFFFNSRSWKNDTSRPTLTPIWNDKTTISYWTTFIYPNLYFKFLSDWTGVYNGW